MRSVLFDKVTFQHKRLNFRIRHNIFKPCNMAYHRTNLCRVIFLCHKILTHPVFQYFCFSDIYYFIIFVVHQIHPGLLRKIFQLFFQIKHSLTLALRILTTADIKQQKSMLYLFYHIIHIFCNNIDYMIKFFIF